MESISVDSQDQGAFGTAIWGSRVSSFTDRRAQWIWKGGSAVQDRFYSTYRTFTLPRETTVQMKWTCDNEGRLFIDGEDKTSGPYNRWTTASSVSFTLPAGEHLVEIHCKNYGSYSSRNPIAVLASALDASTGESIFRTGGGQWKWIDHRYVEQ